VVVIWEPLAIVAQSFYVCFAYTDHSILNLNSNAFGARGKIVCFPGVGILCYFYSKFPSIILFNILVILF